MKRKINFSPGPAILPESVLQQLAAATLEYEGTGIALPELQHRGPEFAAILEESKALVRELCRIGDDYEVLFLHGGGRLQFCMVPMNFLPDGKTAAFIDTGQWAHEAMEYAAYYGNASIIASSKESGYAALPAWPQQLPADTAYLHITTNNTIYGTQWDDVPATTAPLIADMSSDILSCPRDYSRYAMFYAAAQKNLGMAGVALAVIHKDMLRTDVRRIPPMLSYMAQVAQNSVLNTANIVGIYTTLLMLRWTKEKGMAAIAQENRDKAQLLYDHLDNSNIFIPRVKDTAHRSLMNVCFTAITPVHETAFLQWTAERNITGIKGHRYAGAFRASLYNAVPLSDVQYLVNTMKEYEQQHQ